MPDSLSGLTVLVFLITPGFIYVLADERRRLPIRRSPFNETTRVVVASVGALVLAAAGIVLWELLPTPTLVNVEDLLTSPSAYTEADPVRASGALAMLFLGACAVAFTVGKWGQRPLHAVFSGPHGRESSWYTLMGDAPADGEAPPMVSCYLKSGEVVRGRVGTYTSDPTESLDRSLILIAPIVIGRPESGHKVLGTGAVTITAHEISWLHVEYGEEDDIVYVGLPEREEVNWDNLAD
jgi:hypothetical protein